METMILPIKDFNCLRFFLLLLVFHNVSKLQYLDLMKSDIFIFTRFQLHNHLNLYPIFVINYYENLSILLTLLKH